MCQALREIMKEDFEQAEANGMKKGMQQGMQQGIQKGMQQGMAKGESMLGSLIKKLKDAGRLDDAFRAAEDPDFRQKLYKEFKLA